MSKRAYDAHVRRLARTDKPRDPSDFSVKRAAKLAKDSLALNTPALSAKRPAGRIMVVVLIGVTLTCVLGGLNLFGLGAVWNFVTLWFGGIGVLRALACLVPPKFAPIPAKGQHFDIMPTWTILIALYDEADSVPSLLDSLAKLDWAPSQLDIIFACEHDDKPTLEVLSAAQSQHQFRIVRVPRGGPRTKPNALQTALPFAIGRFVTVYDAEDRPHPDQLRAAFHAFMSGPSRLAVVQAPLVTWNHTESWIARQFALDYAIWFRVILPALSKITPVLPLGGTSNHFRRDALVQAGGWDPYNVTEDADLGIRLGRMGYGCALIVPPTYEEAPPRIVAWVKQRGRWIQGHIQTLSVHARQPTALVRGLSWRGMIGFIVGLGIGPLSAVLMLPISECSVVVLPEPVGPTHSSMP